jgi:DNA-binding MarR family transcriptional regulator
VRAGGAGNVASNGSFTMPGGIEIGWVKMAAQGTLDGTTGLIEQATSDTVNQYAEILLWLQPRFTRWAMARVPQQPTAGDLSFQQLTVLYLVRTEGVTLAELARRCMVAPTVITGIVDRLERQGFIRREADPHDRRVNRLVLTEDGIKVSLEVERGLASEVAAQLSDFTAKELRELSRGLELLDRVTTRLASARPGKQIAG